MGNTRALISLVNTISNVIDIPIKIGNIIGIITNAWVYITHQRRV